MFGVVPKTLWSRQIPADDKNRIRMAMRCLLIKSLNTGRIYLVDNGSGNKFNEKMAGIYGLDYEHSDLISSLGQAGVQPEAPGNRRFQILDSRVQPGLEGIGQGRGRRQTGGEEGTGGGG